MKKNNLVEISKYEIYYVLHSRLKTHNRTIKLANKNIYFLPNLYWSLFKDYKKNYSNGILFKEIMKIVFYYGNKEKINFENIDRFLMELETRKLKIVVDNKEYYVITPIKNMKNKIEAFEELILSDDAFRNATIDHNPTFKSFFKKCSEENKIPIFFEISKHLNPNNSKAKKIDKKMISWAKKYIDDNNKSYDEIWKELEYISNHQKLEIVHTKYNFKE